MFLSDLPPPPVTAETIIVTASRFGEPRDTSPASVSLIEPQRVERLGEPLLASLLRLTPSASLSTSGTAGSQSQLRLRGAEANHSLLFIDGIRANDPAAGNEPRFELLSVDLADRIEVVRGPQSALWGSEAIGGVIALSAAPRSGAQALAEGGSSGFGRVSGSVGAKDEALSFGLAAGLQGARGINSFAGSLGDRDGYRNGVLRGRLDWRRGPVTLTGSGFGIRARADFDGSDPVTFARADTADRSRNRLAAGRIGLRFQDGEFDASIGMSRLQSSNRNYLEAAERNRTSGRRDTISAQAGGMLTSGGLSHRFTVAGEWSGERFIASDTAFGGFTNQRRERNQAALTAEYRLETGPLLADVALRRDRFSDFTDATNLRVGGLLRLGNGIALAANWGEGIAQPTFFDLYGFFPASFVGNPALKPERSRGGEVSLRYTGGPWRATATLWRQKLQDEIVDRYNPATFLSTTENSAGRSRREGAEVEAGWSAGPGLNLHAQFTLLDATEPAGRELRRPRRSGSVSADGTVGRLTYGAAVAYTGARLDRDFDLFPAPLVRLSPYWLASARIAYEVAAGLEIFGRLANAFDDRVVDVVGYRSEGRTAFAGIRLGLGR